jgi:hypothetical protein
LTPRVVSTRRLYLTVTLSMAGIYAMAPFPSPQAVIHAFLVLGIAPGLKAPLQCALLASAAGWLSEVALRTYPAMGGTAMGNMLCAVLLWYSLSLSPPGKPFVYYIQLAIAVVLHAAAVYFFVNIASGPHEIGYGWQWSLVLLPAWGALAWRFYTPPHMR